MEDSQAARRGRPPIQDGQDAVNSQQVSVYVAKKDLISLLRFTRTKLMSTLLAPEEETPDASRTEVVPCPETSGTRIRNGPG